LIPGIGHSPQREAPEATFEALVSFANRILRLHGEGALEHAA
jgi:pimeloyl-ACP methyl ester carboxylesterase